MSDRADIEHEGGPADGRPRREPPMIEGEAVEIPLEPPGWRPPGGSRARALYDRLVRELGALLASPKLTLALAAAVVAAVIGAGASWMFLSDGADAPTRGAGTATSAPPSRAVPAAEAEPATPPAAPGRSAEASADPEFENRLETRLAAVTAALAATTDRLAALEHSVRDAAADARTAAARADKAVAEFDEAKKEAKQNGDEREAAQQLDRGALDDLSDRLKTLESRQMTMRQMQDRLDRLSGSTDRDVRAAFAAAAVRTAVDRDRPFSAELAAAQALGLDAGAAAALAPFAATGLPRTNVLLRDLSALLPDLRLAATPPGEDLGYLDRLQASAVRMLKIRPVKDEPGDDPAAVLSRIEFKMAHEDIDAVIAELDKLPPAAKAIVEPWRARAAARRDALEAVRLLTAATLTRLGGDTGGDPSPR